MTADAPVRRLFVYGTLLFDDVLKRVIGRAPERTKAFIEGYKRYAVKGQLFPAIIPCEGEKVEGLLLSVTQKEADLLDEYEGTEYVHHVVTAHDVDSAKEETVSVYVWTYKLDLLEGDWDPDYFVANNMKKYLGAVDDAYNQQNAVRHP
eukprot:comp12052_c0_seq1/m.6760 comp12052_c0_seq1/g.6760  ORF comp12052_c0_seq1/g.6760 comp12052_c0_seq1/m.6760 type:complete len:149 (-) comp12052_c0_seq1:360-806(-)